MEREQIEQEIRDILTRSPYTQDEKIKQIADYVITTAGKMAMESINHLNN